MTTPPLRVGIIGTGRITVDLHLPGWLKIPQAQVVALADPSATALAEAAAVAQIDRCTSDYRRLLDDPQIDVIDVCVPSARHAEVTVAALEAGKHVLCEKPMAVSYAHARMMLTVAQRMGRKLMIGHHMRFEPSVQQLAQGLQAYPLGDVYYTRAQWLRRRRLPARPGFIRRELSGGGPLFDIGVHMLDLAWWLLGCPRPESASGTTFAHLAHRGDLSSEWGTWDANTIDVEDFGVGQIRFEGNRLLLLEASWLGFQPDMEQWRLQFYGTQAGAVWPENRICGERAGQPWDLQLPPGRGQRAHHELIRQFVQALLDDTPVPIPPWQTAGAVGMIEALYRSAAEGREVPVPELARE